MHFGQHTGHSSSWNCLICFHKTCTQHLTTGLQQCSCPRTQRISNRVRRTNRENGRHVCNSKQTALLVTLCLPITGLVLVEQQQKFSGRIRMRLLEYVETIYILLWNCCQLSCCLFCECCRSIRAFTFCFFYNNVTCCSIPYRFWSLDSVVEGKQMTALRGQTSAHHTKGKHHICCR